jgi:hypothetical protein
MQVKYIIHISGIISRYQSLLKAKTDFHFEMQRKINAIIVPEPKLRLYFFMPAISTSCS